MLRTLKLLILLPYLLIVRVIYKLLAMISGGNAHPVDMDIERCSASDVDLSAAMLTTKPLILEGLTDSLSVSDVASLNAFQTLSESNDDPLTVDVYDAASPYFLYTGDYGKRLVQTENISLAEFLEAMFSEKRFDSYAVYQLFYQQAVGGKIANILRSFAEALREVADTEPELGVSGVWIGSKGVITPLHLDAWQTMLIQAEGSKAVTLFSPADIDSLYFLSPFSVGKRWSHLAGRSQDSDLTVFPKFKNASAYRGVLNKGDALIIPPFWPHEAEALEANIGVPFRFDVRSRNYLNPFILRAVIEELSSQR